MFSRTAPKQNEYEAKLAEFYDSARRMKQETVKAAEFVAGYACVFIFMVERLEPHPKVYAAIDAVFRAKGHPLGEMKRHCYDIRARLKQYVSENHPYL